MPSFYSELFDTVRNERSEQAMAIAVLKVQMIGPGPTFLSLNHAVNAPFIIDDCADDDAFCQLVGARRIQFRPYPGAALKDPIALLRSQLLAPEAILTEWDQDIATWTRAVPPSATFKQGRAMVAAAIQENKPTGCRPIDERIERVRKLAYWIGKAGNVDAELRRQGWMEDGMQNAHYLLPEDDRHVAVRSVFKALRDHPGRGQRSVLYAEIEHRLEDSEEQRLAKDVVDAIYSQTVARSLQTPLHSARRVESGVASDYHVAPASPCAVAAIEIPEDLRDGARELELTWNHVEQLQDRLRGKDPDREVYENAVKTLATIAGKAAPAPFALELASVSGAAISVACGLIQVQMGGLLANFVLGAICSVLGGVVVGMTAQATKETRVAAFHHTCYGWLDKVLMPDAGSSQRDNR